MEATVDIPTGMMTTEDAAETLGVSVEYLKDLREKGMGPAYLAIAGDTVRYHPEVIDSWRDGIELKFDEADW
jgi:hypothetical protein